MNTASLVLVRHSATAANQWIVSLPEDPIGSVATCDFRHEAERIAETLAEDMGYDGYTVLAS